METYDGGLAAQSVKHFYGGAGSTPKQQKVLTKKKKCKKGKK